MQYAVSYINDIFSDAVLSSKTHVYLFPSKSFNKERNSSSSEVETLSRSTKVETREVNEPENTFWTALLINCF
mgnify:CR=1 FL=1